jgi:tetratricopeptide (TPR) repeat protein
LLAIRERALGLEHPDLAWSLNGFAELSRIKGELEKAESLFERALAIRENALGVDHPDVATSLKDYALLLRELRDMGASLAP